MSRNPSTALALLLLAAAAAAAPPVHTYEEAQALATKTSRLIVMDFGAEW